MRTMPRPPPFPPLPRNATENFFVENSTADSTRRFPPSWEPGNGSAASAPPRLTVWSHERGAREAASKRESEHPPPPLPPALPVTSPPVWYKCSICEPGSPISKDPRAHAASAGWRTGCRPCDVCKRPSHGSGFAACWTQLHVDMRACRACRSRRISPSWAASPRRRLPHAVSVV